MSWCASHDLSATESEPLPRSNAPGRFYLTFLPRSHDKDHFRESSAKSAIPSSTWTRPGKSPAQVHNHGGGAHLPLSQGYSERHRQEDWSLLSRHRGLSAPLQRRSGRRVAGQGLRCGFARLAISKPVEGNPILRGPARLFCSSNIFNDSIFMAMTAHLETTRSLGA